jgi:ATP-binding cassette subfamily B (MDR/TAP) protein 1
MAMLSIAALFTGFFQKLSFGLIGENVAFNIRKALYTKLIQKHQGWYDQRENSPGILTTTLSSDAQIINGVSSEGLGSIIEAACAVTTGLVIAFLCSWRMSVVCVVTAPVALLTGYM